MNILKSIFFIVMLWSSIVFTSHVFSQTIIKVVDQNNAPLPNTVIEYGLTELPKKTETTQHIYVMDQIDKSFVPHVLIVPQNSLVSFPNSDDIRHHVYSFSPAKTFELKLYAGKPKNPIRFEQNGVVVMGCNIHDSMIGYIYISTKSNTYLTNKHGEAKLPKVLPVNTQLQIWHPNNTKGVSEHTLFTITPSMLKNKVITLVLLTNTPAVRDSFESLVFDER